MSKDNTSPSCAACSAVWQKSGTTNCWSGDPATAPPRPGNCPSSTAEEEVKYTLDDDGYVRDLSKQVEGGLGEAVGINYVSSTDRVALVRTFACANARAEAMSASGATRSR